MRDYIKALSGYQELERLNAVRECRTCAEGVALEGKEPDPATVAANCQAIGWTLPQFVEEVERIKTRAELIQEHAACDVAYSEIPPLSEKIEEARAALKIAEDTFEEIANPLRAQIRARNDQYLSRPAVEQKLRDSAGPGTVATINGHNQRLKELDAERRELKSRLESRNLFVSNNDQTKNQEEEPWKSQRAAWIAESLLINEQLTAKNADVDTVTKQRDEAEAGLLTRAVSW